MMSLLTSMARPRGEMPRHYRGDRVISAAGLHTTRGIVCVVATTALIASGGSGVAAGSPEDPHANDFVSIAYSFGDQLAQYGESGTPPTACATHPGWFAAITWQGPLL